MFALVQTAARGDDSNATLEAKKATLDAKHLMNCWADQAYSRALVTILEYAGLRADLRPSTLGRYNPVAPEAVELKHQLEAALRWDAAWYFEPL